MCVKIRHYDTDKNNRQSHGNLQRQKWGGKSETYITQSKTTVFHDFFTRKFLGEGETVEEFMEVSEAERDRLQGIRDAWVRPPQVFIDQWNTACGIWGRYNEETGYFELNGLTDITYEQALSIMAAGPLIDSLSPFAGGLFSKIRTNLPSVRASGFGYVHRLITLYTYIFSANFEVVNLNPATQEEDLCVSNDHSIADYTFVSRKYIGALNLKLYNKSLNLTTQCGKYNKAFDGLVIKELHTDAKIRASWASVTREYDAEFLTKMVGYATNTTPITIQVEQWAYDRLTDPDNAEWNSILTAAAEKNITFVA